jgi:hypothetical protein
VGIRGRTRLAHRYYYERANGPIPGGLELHHVCGNHACVNPAHLVAMSKTEHAHFHNLVRGTNDKS